MLEMTLLGSIVFYFGASAYLDGLYRERAKVLARTRRPFPDIWIMGGLELPRKTSKSEKVDWQHEGF